MEMSLFEALGQAEKTEKAGGRKKKRGGGGDWSLPPVPLVLTSLLQPFFVCHTDQETRKGQTETDSLTEKIVCNQCSYLTNFNDTARIILCQSVMCENSTW